MNEVLACLMKEYSVNEIVRALRDLCLKQAKEAKPAGKPEREAMWKCNSVELDMTAGSLYSFKNY